LSSLKKAAGFALAKYFFGPLEELGSASNALFYFNDIVLENNWSANLNLTLH